MTEPKIQNEVPEVSTVSTKSKSEPSRVYASNEAIVTDKNGTRSVASVTLGKKIHEAWERMEAKQLAYCQKHANSLGLLESEINPFSKELMGMFKFDDDGNPTALNEHIHSSVASLAREFKKEKGTRTPQEIKAEGNLIYRNHLDQISELEISVLAAAKAGDQNSYRKLRIELQRLKSS